MLKGGSCTQHFAATELDLWGGLLMLREAGKYGHQQGRRASPDKSELQIVADNHIKALMDDGLDDPYFHFLPLIHQEPSMIFQRTPLRTVAVWDCICWKPKLWTDDLTSIVFIQQ